LASLVLDFDRSSLVLDFDRSSLVVDFGRPLHDFNGSCLVLDRPTLPF
jgi:hypothetical protein